MSDSEDSDEVPTLYDLDYSIQSNHDNNASSSQELPPVPVTILTGFLGSGKTTLLKNILTSKQHNRRIAVIENEFGGGESPSNLFNGLSQETLSVETMIAKDGTDGSSLSDLIELPNGCVCCTVKDSLVETLENLLEKRSDLDYIIIECSGMADPGPVASIFWLDDALGSRLRLDGVVGVVDVMNILKQLEDTSSFNGGGGGDEAARQIAFADRIIVNKIDLMNESNRSDGDNINSRVQNVLESIKVINPTTPTLLTTYSKLEDLNWILDTQCFNPERAQEVENAYEQLIENQCYNVKCICSQQYCGYCNDDSGQDASVDTAVPTSQHYHTSTISTIALFNIGSIDLRKLNLWLASALWPNQDEKDSVLRARLELADDQNKETTPNNANTEQQSIYRIKGVISIAHSDTLDNWNDEESTKYKCANNLDKRRYIVQAVNDLWDVTPASDELCWTEEETRCCKIVIIGKWLNEEKLKQEFEECFCTS